MTGCQTCGAPTPSYRLAGIEYAFPFCETHGTERASETDAAERDRAVADALAAAGATRRVQTYTFDTYPQTHGGAQAVVLAREWIEAYRRGEARNLYVWGDPGSGKTGLAWAIVREVLRDEYAEARRDARPMRRTATLVDVREYLAACRAAFDGGSVWHPYSVRLAVLDDLGAERETGFAVEAIGRVVSRRYDAMLPTIVTSNHSPAELADRFEDADPTAGRRMLSRLCGDAVRLELAPVDRRQAVAA